MKRIIKLSLIGAFFVSLFSPAEIDKKELLTKIAEKYKNLKSISGRAELNMLMMGNVVKIPVFFWKEGKKTKMKMVMYQPGMPEPMEQIMLFDGKKMMQYQKISNTVIIIDFTKLPEDMKNRIKNQQGLSSLEDFTPKFEKYLEKISVGEKKIKGKSFYVITVNDLQSIGVNSNIPMKQNMPESFFKKVDFWIEKNSYLPFKIELFGETETPGLTVKFFEVKTDPIPPEVFKIEIPEDAKIIDMTEMMIKMAENLKKFQEEENIENQ